jgi:hypothetical protein
MLNYKQHQSGIVKKKNVFPLPYPCGCARENQRVLGHPNLGFPPFRRCWHVPTWWCDLFHDFRVSNRFEYPVLINLSFCGWTKALDEPWIQSFISFAAAFICVHPVKRRSVTQLWASIQSFQLRNSGRPVLLSNPPFPLSFITHIYLYTFHEINIYIYIYINICIYKYICTNINIYVSIYIYMYLYIYIYIYFH